MVQGWVLTGEWLSGLSLWSLARNSTKAVHPPIAGGTRSTEVIAVRFLVDGSKELNTVCSLEENRLFRLLTLNSELSVTGLQFISITLQNDLVLIRTPH